MIGQVIADVQIFDLAILAKFFIDVFVKIFEMMLRFAWVDRGMVGVRRGRGIGSRRDHVGSLVHVREEERRANCGAIVEAGATVSVSADADFEVERAVYSVFLCAKNGGQVFRHN